MESYNICAQLILILLTALVVGQVNSYEDCSSKEQESHYWSEKTQLCLPCTRCHDNRLITLIGCAPDKDAICGTIEDLRHQWLLPSLRNGEDISSNFASTNSQMSKKSNIAGSAVFGSPSDSSDRKVKSEVYGRTRYGPPRGQENSDKSSATHRVKESVRNASQKKNEFLRKLQEIEQISVSKKVKEEQEEVDGTVHFSEDEVFGHHIGSGGSGDRNLHGGDALHHDLETIEKELQKENEAAAASNKNVNKDLSSTNSLNHPTESIQIISQKTSSTMENKKSKTKLSTLAPPITVWFNGNNGQLETHEITSSTEKFDDYVGKEQFFATGPYLGSGPDVYGAVVQEPRDSQFGMVGSGSAEVNEFGLLKRILYKEPNDRNIGKSPSISMENPNVITVKLEHVLVAVGFCLGFGFVFCIAIVYYKVKPLQRFNILNNQTVTAGSVAGAHDSSSMSSGNSSFQQTDSRLTSLTASPLLSQAQSPCVMVRAPGISPKKLSPVLNREDVSPSVLNIPNSNRHSVYVDQRGRTSLKQSRELPV